MESEFLFRSFNIFKFMDFFFLFWCFSSLSVTHQEKEFERFQSSSSGTGYEGDTCSLNDVLLPNAKFKRCMTPFGNLLSYSAYFNPSS